MARTGRRDADVKHHGALKAAGTAPTEEPDGYARSSLTPSTARGEVTKRRILDVAEEVFGEQGYYEASVSEITRRAGVAQGTFYIYYHSKLEIFVELIADLGARVRGAMREATLDVPGRLEAERRGFAAFFAFVRDHRRIYRIVQEAERVAPDAAHDYYRRISEGYVRGLTAAMATGEIRQLDPEATAYALMGIGHFLALRWLVWPQPDGETGESGIPTEVYESVVQLIEHGLAGEKAP
ncbi:MAG TPA: TetR/AcrR family transcriptional regulator [Ktedonobacterales bacterium]